MIITDNTSDQFDSTFKADNLPECSFSSLFALVGELKPLNSTVFRNALTN